MWVTFVTHNLGQALNGQLIRRFESTSSFGSCSRTRPASSRATGPPPVRAVSLRPGILAPGRSRPLPSASPPHLDPILRTKLHRPPVTEDLVCRTRLHERLDLGLETPVTLVAAPAGYGKSMLVSQWAESREAPCAWISLDEADSDLGLFLRYVVAAVEKVAVQLLQSNPENATPLIRRWLGNAVDYGEV